LDEPLTIDENRREAISGILSFKREFEVGMAITAATADAPHFIDVNGAWAVKPVRIRNGEVIRVPLITLSIVWHDGSGNNHEAFLQLSERDWSAFRDKVETLAGNQKELEVLL
jgi:hypothetical protein